MKLNKNKVTVPIKALKQLNIQSVHHKGCQLLTCSLQPHVSKTFKTSCLRKQGEAFYLSRHQQRFMDNEAYRGFSTRLQDGNELKMMFLQVDRGQIFTPVSSLPLKTALWFVYSATTLKVTNFSVVLFMHSGSQLLPADLTLHLQTNQRCRAGV